MVGKYLWLVTSFVAVKNTSKGKNKLNLGLFLKYKNTNFRRLCREPDLSTAAGITNRYSLSRRQSVNPLKCSDITFPFLSISLN